MYSYPLYPEFQFRFCTTQVPMYDMGTAMFGGPYVHHHEPDPFRCQEPEYGLEDIHALRQVAWDLHKLNPDLARNVEAKINSLHQGLIQDMERDLLSSERDLEYLKKKEADHKEHRFLRTRLLLFARELLNGGYNV